MIRVALALLIGAAGGLLFSVLHVPAPWIAGSMIAAVIAVYSGLRFHIPGWLRIIAFILLGIQTGASVNMETLIRAGQWPLSLLALAGTVVLVTWSGTVFYRRMHHWDMPTAFFGSLPGALSLVLILADEAKADMRRVTISQSIRLFFLVAALPGVIEFMSPVRVELFAAPRGSVMETLIVVVAATAAGLGLERLRVPAGLILGSALASAALSLSGVTHGATPDGLLILANVILGVMIAERFRNFTLPQLKESLSAALGAFIIALVISVAGAALASWAASLPLALTLLAFSPGGLDAMTILALALDLDPAYVAAHQVARYIGICLLLPPIAAWLMRPRGNAATRSVPEQPEED